MTESPLKNRLPPTNQPPGKGNSRWLLIAVVLLVVVTLVGWGALAWSRFAPRPAMLAPIATATPTTRPLQSPTPAATARPGQPTPTLALRPSVTAAPPLAYGVVTSQTLNLRAAPNFTAEVLSSMKNGSIIPLARRDGGWYQTTEGAWISALYLEVRQTRAEAESYARELASP